MSHLRIPDEFEAAPADKAAPKKDETRQTVVDGRLNPKYYGGFKGLSAAHNGGGSPTRADRRNKSRGEAGGAAGAAAGGGHDQVTHIDPLAVRCAEVPFGAWCAQKEKRVQTAFTRVIERDWYDKWEMTLRPVERAHLNAVREHYAMRRDKLKTPDIKARPKSNTLTRKGWAESMEAMEVLNRDTNVGGFFHGLVGRTIAKRQRQEEQARAAAERARAEAEARRAHMMAP